MPLTITVSDALLNGNVSADTLKGLAAGGVTIDTGKPIPPQPTDASLSPIPDETKYFFKGYREAGLAAIGNDAALNADQRAYLLSLAANYPLKADFEAQIASSNPQPVTFLRANGFAITQANVDEFIWQHREYQSDFWRALQKQNFERTGPSGIFELA